MQFDPATCPVIVGTGQVNDRPADPLQGRDPPALMAEALRLADADAGGGWLARVDSLAVVSQISFPQLNPVDGRVAELLGIAPRHSEQTPLPHGDGPVRLLDEAATRIAQGRARVVAVTGAEALRTAGALAKAGGQGGDNVLQAAARARPTDYRGAYGLRLPVDVYPLYENALRASLGQSLAEGQAESGAIWAAMSQMAAANPAAWMREPVAAETIVTPSADNRPIAFPYTKLMVANATVNQGAGFIVTSLAEARAHGIADDRPVFVGLGAAAKEPADFLARADYRSSPSLEISIREALRRNGVAAEDLAHAELYSCFPCMPKMARRVLGWPLDRPVSLFGGLTFGGGPIANYMSHAVASMVDALRAGGGKGLLFANGGYATDSHTIMLGSEPFAPTGAPRDYDVQAQADALRGPVPSLDPSYAGAAEIESYTVHYRRDGSARSGTIVARTAQGSRTLALVPGEDTATIAFLTDGAAEPVGARGEIVAGEGGLSYWRAA